jgi:hypothetical protein
MTADQFSKELERIKNEYDATMEAIRAEAYDAYRRNLATLCEIVKQNERTA